MPVPSPAYQGACRAGTIHVLDVLSSGSVSGRYPEEIDFPRAPRSDGMTKNVLAILLACLMAAATQVSAQAPAAQNPPAAGGNGAEQAPTVSGPEYNAYMGAIQQQD